MTRPMSRHPFLKPALSTLFFWIVFSVVAGISTSRTCRLSWADETIAAPSLGELDFRRVFVPADSPETWPIGSDRYLPMPRAEFLRLLGNKQMQATDSQHPQISISEVVYRAELSSANVLQGQADIKVELLGSAPRLLPLSPMNLAVLSAAWRRDPTQLAAIGMWKRKDSLVQQSVLVEQTGMLQLRWELAARRSDASHIDFSLQLPPVAPQRLELLLPASHTASLPTGQLLQTKKELHGKRRWVFQLSASDTHRLQISREGTSHAKEVLPLVSQTTSYQVEPTGLTFATQIQVDSRESEIAELRARLVEGLRIVEVTLDKQPIAWRRVEGEEETSLVIPWPESFQPQLLEIRALAKIRPDTAWQLPQLRLQKVAWSEGAVSLFVAPEFELNSITPRQANFGIADVAQVGETYRLQEWSEQAAVVIHLGRPAAKLTAQTATTIELGREEAEANIVTLLSNSGRNVYQLQAAVARGWTIDSVVTSPNGALNGWQLDSAGESGQLRVQLNQAVAREDDLRLEIKARVATGKLVLPATVQELQLLRFSDVSDHRQLLELRTHESQQLALARPLVQVRLPLDQLTPEESSLFAKAPTGTLLDVTDLDQSQVVELRQEPIEYTADIQIELEATPNSSEHHIQIDGHPLSGAIAEIALELDEPLPESLQWELAGQRGAVIVQQIKNSSNEEALAKDTTHYLLRLPVAMAEDFRLQASYSLPAQSVERCNLVNLPKASGWTGHVLLRGSLQEFRVLDSGWASEIAPANPDPQRLPLLGAYRLSSEERRRKKKQDSPCLERRASSVTPSVVAWLAEYHTLQAADGAALHIASYSLDNLGDNEAQLVLPPSAELQEAWLDNQQLELLPIAAKENAYRFRFRRDQRWPHLSLKYATRVLPLGGSASIQPSVPSFDFPVSLSRWTLWVPEQYEIDNSQQNYSAKRYHWWKRIFGPLARSREDSIFNPLGRNNWAQLWSAPLSGQLTKQAAEQFARQLVGRLHASMDHTWGEMLNDLTREESLAKLFYVDRPALLAQDIQAATLCPQGDTSRETRADSTIPLSRYGLALLVSPGTIVLTTAERVAHWHDQLRPTEFPDVYVVSSDDLVDDFEQARHLPISDLVPIGRWQRSMWVKNSPWTKLSATALADVGRRARTVEFIQSFPALTVRRAFFQRALWYALVLLVLVLGVWQLAHYPNTMILIAALACAACLVVPVAWLTIPQAVFLGLVAAAIVRICLKTSQLSRVLQTPTGKHVQTAAICLLLGLLPNSACAQPVAKSEAGTAADRQLPRVLVPIDSQGKRQGEDVYLPAKFLEKLRPATQRVGIDHAEFVLLAANYQGHLANDFRGEAVLDQSNLTAPWTLRWKIKTFVPNCQWQLPLQRDEAVWLSNSHRLDGLPVQLDWNENGNGCTVTLPEIGVHWLQLVVRPKITATNRLSTLQLHIPPLPGAKLELTQEPNIKALRIYGASRTTNTDARNYGTRDSSSPNPQQYLVEARNTLRLRWSSLALKNASVPWDRLEQRSWLRVDPAATRLDMQLSVTALQAVAPTLSLEISPQLRLVPPGKDSPIAEVLPPTANQPNRLQLKLRAGLPADFMIPLRFDLQRTSSVGRIFFPRVRVLNTPPAQNSFAVSVSSDLSYDENIANNVRSIEPDVFAQSWNASTIKPLYAYDLGQEDPEWSLRVWPNMLLFLAQQTVRVDCLPNETRVNYTATVDGLTKNMLLHRLELPESLHIDKITVRTTSPLGQKQQQQQQPVRWSRVSPNSAVVFLGRPLRQPHQLHLQGHIPTSAGGELEPPFVQLLGAESGKVHLDLYRDEEVQVLWEDLEPAPGLLSLPVSAVPPGNMRPNEALHVGHSVWQTSEARPLSRLRVERNHKKFDTTTVTTLELDPAGWSASLNSRLHVRQGILRRLRLAVPASFREPYVLLPRSDGSSVGSLSNHIRETPTGKEIQVLLSRPAVEGEEIEVRLRGNLSLPAASRLKVPDLRWVDATRKNRFLVLPIDIDGQTLDWHTSGLSRHSLPRSLQAYAPDQGSTLAFRVDQSRFAAEESSLRGLLRSDLVRYANVAVSLDQQGQITATAEVVLQPGRATSCQLQLPPQSQLIQLIVGDQPVRREQLKNGRWHIPLGPPFMPYRILVSYRSRKNLDGERIQFEPPQVFLDDKSLAMPPVWWRVRPTHRVQIGRPEVGQVTDIVHATERNYRLPLLVLQDALSQALELPREEGLAWFRPWHRLAERAKAKKRSLDSEANNLTGQDQRQDQIIEKAEAAWLSLAESFGVGFSSWATTPQEKSAPIQPMAMTYPPDLPPTPTTTTTSHEVFFVSDSQGQLVLPVSLGAPRNAWQWLAAVTLLCGTLAMVLRLSYKSFWYHQLCYWPHSLALVGGLSWWLLLKPSAIGLLIIVLVFSSFATKRWRDFRLSNQRQPDDRIAAPTHSA